MGDPAKPEIFNTILMRSDFNEILSLKSLKIGYSSGRQKNVLLPPLTASANKGELIAVLGRNGIGKSTLLRTLTGIQPSMGGEIIFAGKNLRDYSRVDLARKVGYISTEIVNVNNMSVYDLVALGRFPHTNWIGKITSNDYEIIIDAIEKTTMLAFRNKYVFELSDGERQKAMIARILAQDTDIMVMDEPTAFLDMGSKYEILHLLHTLSQKNDKTIIFSTHDFNMAISQSDKIWLILENQLIEGAPEDLMIEGAFNHIFDSSPVMFDSENGNFSFRGEERGELYIEGDGHLRHWTAEAIKRAGFSVAEVRTKSYIKVTSIYKNKWQLISQDSMAEFSSLYDLLCSLRKEDLDLI
jgi:iron complex transport system ATP-binding protein